MDVIKSVAEAWPRIRTAGAPVMPYDSTKQTELRSYGYIPSGIKLIDDLFATWKPRVVYIPLVDMEVPSPNFDHRHNHIELFTPACYKDAATYAHSAAHELAHWSGWGTRMDRVTMREGRRAEEEVVADLTAGLLLDKAGALGDNLELVQVYVAHWLTVGYPDEIIWRMLHRSMLTWGGNEEEEKFPSAEEAFEEAAALAKDTMAYLLTRVNYGATK